MGHDLGTYPVGLEGNLLKSVNTVLGNTVVSETKTAYSRAFASLCYVV